MSCKMGVSTGGAPSRLNCWTMTLLDDDVNVVALRELNEVTMWVNLDPDPKDLEHLAKVLVLEPGQDFGVKV